MSESCGQCECCAAWRAGRDRLTRERDERVLKSDYNSMVRLLNKAEHERDRLRALLGDVQGGQKRRAERERDEARAELAAARQTWANELAGAQQQRDELQAERDKLSTELLLHAAAAARLRRLERERDEARAEVEVLTGERDCLIAIKTIAEKDVARLTRLTKRRQ